LPQEIDSSPPRKIDGTDGHYGLDIGTLGYLEIGSPEVFAQNAECTPAEVGSTCWTGGNSVATLD